jgi:hypothetical protein
MPNNVIVLRIALLVSARLVESVHPKLRFGAIDRAEILKDKEDDLVRLTSAPTLKFPAEFKADFTQLVTSTKMNITAAGVMWSTPSAQRQDLKVYVTSTAGPAGSYSASGITDYTTNTTSTFKGDPLTCQVGVPDTQLPLWDPSLAKLVPYAGTTMLSDGSGGADQLADVFVVQNDSRSTTYYFQSSYDSTPLALTSSANDDSQLRSVSIIYNAVTAGPQHSVDITIPVHLTYMCTSSSATSDEAPAEGVDLPFAIMHAPWSWVRA